MNSKISLGSLYSFRGIGHKNIDKSENKQDADNSSTKHYSDINKIFREALGLKELLGRSQVTFQYMPYDEYDFLHKNATFHRHDVVKILKQGGKKEIWVSERKPNSYELRSYTKALEGTEQDYVKELLNEDLKGFDLRAETPEGLQISVLITRDEEKNEITLNITTDEGFKKRVIKSSDAEKFISLAKASINKTGKIHNVEVWD